MIKLPKIIGDTWFNSKPLTPEDLNGRIALIDFWTYSCVNCRRTIPYLKEWWKKYKNEDFVMIGIHTPEFEFEKDSKNVERAIKDLGVGWPVVLDNEHINWNNFSNHYWPAKYLFNKTGKLVYEHFGEGSYAETEAAIIKLLNKGGIERFFEEYQHGNVCFVSTPEIYCGYERGRIENHQRYARDQKFRYTAPNELSDDSIALDGEFIARPEYVESAEAGAALILKFRATEVNLVLHPVGVRAVAEASLDSKKLKDIIIIKPTLYNLLKSEQPIEGVLSITAKKGNFRAYAFTFSGCAE